MSLMPYVKVNRSELLTTLNSNLSAHQSEIKELLEARREEVKQYITDVANKLDSDESYQPKDNVKFPMPCDNSSSYLKAIRMVEMSVDEVITLTEYQFDQLVMDNWSWKQELLSTSALYGKLK